MSKLRRTELTLKPGECVRVGPVVIFNSGRRTNRGLRLGFEAPREIGIVRAELVEQAKGGEQ